MKPASMANKNSYRVFLGNCFCFKILNDIMTNDIMTTIKEES